MKERDYADLAAQAEKAVANVKDPELRRIAYQKILEDLLSTPRKEERKGPRVAARHPDKTPASKPRGGPQAYIEELVSEGFFEKQKTISQVKAELENRGRHIPMTHLSTPLQRLCQRRVLRRQKSSASDDKKPTFVYSIW